MIIENIVKGFKRMFFIPSSKTIASKKEPIEKETLTCPTCRSEIGEEDTFCQMCGKKVK